MGSKSKTFAVLAPQESFELSRWYVNRIFPVPTACLGLSEWTLAPRPLLSIKPVCMLRWKPTLTLVSGDSAHSWFCGDTLWGVNPARTMMSQSSPSGVLTLREP